MVYALKKCLGQERLEADRQTVKLRYRPDLWLDVDHFHQLLAASERHDHCQGATELCATCLESLTKAVALTDGDFLAGFSLPDSPDSDTWQTFETETLRRELTGALERLVQFWTRDDKESLEQAMAYARRWLALDPLNPGVRHQARYRRVSGRFGRPGRGPGATTRCSGPDPTQRLGGLLMAGRPS